MALIVLAVAFLAKSMKTVYITSVVIVIISSIMSHGLRSGSNMTYAGSLIIAALWVLLAVIIGRSIRYLYHRIYFTVKSKS